MPDLTFLSWPFFEPRHRELADKLQNWSDKSLPEPTGDLDEDCRALVQALGSAGFLKLSVGDAKHRPETRFALLTMRV